MSLVLTGILASACAAPATAPARKPLAKVDRIDGTVGRITLDSKAARRIGIKTAPVQATRGGNVLPYSALIYDTKGDTYTYTNPSSLVYVRESIRVKAIRGEQVILAKGPPVGVFVVSVGASQLFGIELGIGS